MRQWEWRRAKWSRTKTDAEQCYVVMYVVYVVALSGVTDRSSSLCCASVCGWWGLSVLVL